MLKRRMFGVAALVAGTSALVTGCDKPPPAISVWSGTHSVNAPALCWAFDDAALTPQECASDILQGSRSDGLPSLPTSAGNTFGISVDPVVAEAGWQIRVDGQPVVEQTLNTNYYRLVYSTPPQPITLQIVAGQGAEAKGIWLVKLDPSQD
jgi:hypothetical protein